MVDKNQRNLAIVSIIFVTGLVVFLVFDLGTLFTFELSLDATSSGGKASDRGVDASTGHFRGKGFEKKGDRIGNDEDGSNTTVDDSDPTSVTIIDARTGSPIVTNIDTSSGGGAPASTFATRGGFQEMLVEEAFIFPSIHTPAKGQTISAPILIKWLGQNPLVVQQVVFGFDVRDHVQFDLPQTVFDQDTNLDEEGLWEGEFVYELTLPEDFPEDVIIPVSMLVDTGDFTQILSTEIDLTEPQGIVKSFSIAEFFRSIFLVFRVGG